MLWLVLGWIGLSLGLVLLFRFVPPPTSAFMLIRQTSAWVHDEAGFRMHHDWVPLEQIAPSLALAVVASEDQKFPQHHGFDVASIRKALIEAGEGERLRGASTISQQTAKNLFLWGGRSFVRKGIEAWFTVWMELLWPKHRILEVYLNIAEFGDGIYGAEAAARQLFGTSAARLTPRQSALLAAVLPSPRRLHAAHPGAYVERRVNWIRRQMQQLGGPAYLGLTGQAR